MDGLINSNPGVPHRGELLDFLRARCSDPVKLLGAHRQLMTDSLREHNDGVTKHDGNVIPVEDVIPNNLRRVSWHVPSSLRCRNGEI